MDPFDESGEIRFRLCDLPHILERERSALVTSVSTPPAKEITVCTDEVRLDIFINLFTKLSSSISDAMGQVIDVFEQKIIVEDAVHLNHRISGKHPIQYLESLLVKWQKQLHDLQYKGESVREQLRESKLALEKQVRQVDEHRALLAQQEITCVTSYQKNLVKTIIQLYDAIFRIQQQAYKSQEHIRSRFLETLNASIQQFLSNTRGRLRNFLREVEVHVQAHLRYLTALSKHENSKKTIDSDCDVKLQQSLNKWKKLLTNYLEPVIRSSAFDEKGKERLTELNQLAGSVESFAALRLLVDEIKLLQPIIAPPAPTRNILIQQKNRLLCKKLQDFLGELTRTIDSPSRKESTREESDLELRLLHDRRTVKVLRSLSVREESAQRSAELQLAQRLAQDFQTCQRQWEQRQSEWLNSDEWIQIRQSLQYYREETKLKSAYLYRSVLGFGKLCEEQWAVTKHHLQGLWDAVKINMARDFTNDCFALFSEMANLLSANALLAV